MEQWVDVSEWPGYQVSNLGRVMGPRGVPLKGYIDRYGYHAVGLWNRGSMKGFGVHRIVARAFIGEIPPSKQVNHKNGVRNDNRLSNLELVTAKENVQHSFDVLKRVGKNTNPSKGEAHPNSSLNAKKVGQIRALYTQGWTQVRLAEKFKTPQTNISRIIRRAAWRHVD